MIRSYKGKTPQIADGCYVDESAQLIGDVTLGEHSSVWMNCVLRGDVHHIRVGSHSNIQDLSVLHGMINRWPVEVGDWVSVGHAVVLHGCVIEDRCLIGMGARVLNGARVGEGSIVAAGAVVLEGTQIAPRSLWAGVPAKFIKSIDDEAAQLSIMHYANNYLEYTKAYLQELAERRR